MKYENIRKHDPEIANAIQGELKRQQDGLELIASENFVSETVLEAAGSIATNKYAEGYPGRRYYGGMEYVDKIETISIARAKKTIRSRTRKRPAKRRLTSKHGSILLTARTRRQIHGHELRPWGTPHPWSFCKLLRKILQLNPIPSRQRNTLDRF